MYEEYQAMGRRAIVYHMNAFRTLDSIVCTLDKPAPKKGGISTCSPWTAASINWPGSTLSKHLLQGDVCGGSDWRSCPEPQLDRWARSVRGSNRGGWQQPGSCELVTLRGCFQGLQAIVSSLHSALAEANDWCFPCLRDWSTLRAGGTGARWKERIPWLQRRCFSSFYSALLTLSANFKPMLQYLFPLQGWMSVLLSVEAIKHGVSGSPETDLTE